MKKYWEKALAVILTGAMLLTAGGCGNSSAGNGSGPEAETGGEEAETASVKEVNEYGWEVPEQTLEFSAYCGVGDPADFEKELEESNNAMANFLKEKFNVVIDKSVYLDDCTQRVNLMLNTGDYPDLVTHVNETAMQAFVDSGAAIELTDLLNKYGQNILAEIGDNLPLYQNEDGEIYSLPAGYGYKVDTVGNSFSIRYDWWKELNTEVYTTPEEYYEQVKQVLENHPVNEDGKKVYAFTDCDQGQNMLGTLRGAWGFYDKYAVDENDTMTYWMFDDRAEEIVKYINRFWREGMIDPDFLTNEFDTAKTICVTDRAAGDLAPWWRGFVFGHEFWQQENPDTPIERRYMNVSVTAPGVEHHTLSAVDFTNNNDTAIGGFWMITDKCENPEMVMKYLNWESGPWGTLIAWNGVPDPENVYNIEDNKVVMREESLDASKKNVEWHERHKVYGQNDYLLVSRRSALAKGNTELPFELDPRVADTFGTGETYPLSEDLQSYLDPGWNICWQYYDDTKPYNATPFAVSIPASDPMYVVKQDTDEIAKTEWVNIVTANSEEDALQALENAKEKLEQAGIHDLENYRTASFQKNKELLKIDTLWVDNKRLNQ